MTAMINEKFQPNNSQTKHFTARKFHFIVTREKWLLQNARRSA